MKKNDFIINDKVVYDRYKGTVYNISNDEFIVTLQNPANQCLAILIEKQPEIVHQDYFFYHVWEKNGLPVNVNTFYQSISLIRKALKSVGLEEDIIKTTPRLGISIPEYIDIVHIQDQEENKQPSPTETPINLENKEENNSENLIIDNKNKNSSVMPGKNKYIFSLLIIIISSILTYSSKTFFETGSFSGYQYYGKYNHCEIYTSNSFSSVEYISGLAKKLGIPCENNSTLYYSTIRGVYVDTFFHCKDRTCVSYYYVDERKRSNEKN